MWFEILQFNPQYTGGHFLYIQESSLQPFMKFYLNFYFILVVTPMLWSILFECKGVWSLPSDSLITYYRISNNKVKLQVHLLQCLKGIDLKVLGLNGLKRKVRLEK